MNFKAIGSAAALGLAMLASAPAQAITITNTDGTMDWTGFDWDSNGSAFTTGFAPVVGDTFELDVFSWATALKNGPDNILGLRLDSVANGTKQAANWYEYTVHAKLQETVTGCSGTTCTFAVTSGVYSVFYDTSANADARAGNNGTGFTDGVEIIKGGFLAQPSGTFTVTGSGGTGSTSLLGFVTSTNTSFINPALSDTVVGTELKLGQLVTNKWVSTGGFGGVAFTSANEIIFQADASQSFTAKVPEPASLALVASALLAGGLASRRRSKK